MGLSAISSRFNLFEALSQNLYKRTLNVSGKKALLRYRALYEFVARSGDEISFQPGDIILVSSCSTVKLTSVGTVRNWSVKGRGCRRKWDFRRYYFCGHVTFVSGTRR